MTNTPQPLVDPAITGLPDKTRNSPVGLLTVGPGQL